MLASLTISGNAFSQPDSLWSRTYGQGHKEYCTNAILTKQNEYVLAGVKSSLYPNDVYIVKADSAGNVIWTHDEGEPDDISLHTPLSITELTSGDYVLAGYIDDREIESYFAFALCLSPDGDSLWTISLDYSSDQEFFDCKGTRDGGVILAGHSYALDPNGAWLVKVNGAGEVEWEQSYGDPDAPGFEMIWSVVQTQDGGYAIAGNTTSYPNVGQDFFLLKTDSLGNEEWRNHYGTEAGETSYGLTEAPDGGFLLVGYSTLYDNGDFYYVRVDADGALKWERTLQTNYGNYCWDVKALENGFILAGYGGTIDRRLHGEEFYIVRTDNDGEPIWTTYYGIPFSDEECRSVMVHPDGSYSFAGNSVRLGEGQDFWLVRTGVDPASNGVTLLDPAFPSLIALDPPYPNPFNSSVTIGFELPTTDIVTLKVFDQRCREVATLLNGQQRAGNYQVEWDSKNANGMPVASGMYFVRLETLTNTKVNKMMLVK